MKLEKTQAAISIRHTILFFKLVIMNVAIEPSIQELNLNYKPCTMHQTEVSCLYIHCSATKHLLLLQTQTKLLTTWIFIFFSLWSHRIWEFGKVLHSSRVCPAISDWAVSALCKEKAEEKVESTWSAPLPTCSPVNRSFRYKWHLILPSRAEARCLWRESSLHPLSGPTLFHF